MFLQQFGGWSVPIFDIYMENLKGRDESSSCSASEPKGIAATLGPTAGPACVKLKYARAFTVGHTGD